MSQWVFQPTREAKFAQFSEVKFVSYFLVDKGISKDQNIRFIVKVNKNAIFTLYILRMSFSPRRYSMSFPNWRSRICRRGPRLGFRISSHNSSFALAVCYFCFPAILAVQKMSPYEVKVNTELRRPCQYHRDPKMVIIIIATR